MLHHDAKYTINSKALRKWSQERLTLIVLADRSVQARFRYAGTTCSSMGRSLEYDYYLELAPAEEGYKILEMNCVPAPGDTGHACMCEYLSDAKRLAQAMANEKPLLGRPLDAVLAWQRRFSPAGCYCDAVSREHKWGLVLEVVHYALVEIEKRR